jgi:hypothetical protein
MESPLFFYQRTLIALVWLCLMLPWAWPSAPAAGCPTAPEPTPPRPKRHRAPTPFAGFPQKPHCAACEPPRPCSSATTHRAHAGAPPPGRPRAALLPAPGRSVPGLGRLGHAPRQWPSQWRSLAAATVDRLSPLLSGDPRHARAWPARLRGAQRAGGGVPGRRLGPPGHGARVRERPEPGAAVVGGGSRAAADLLTALPA